MIRNFFRIAWRNLLHNKSFSIINILGLAVGMTCTILISLWVYDEWQYDKFQPNYERVQQLIAHRHFDNEVFTDHNMVYPLALEAKEQIPGIEEAVVTSNLENHVLAVGEKKISVNGYYSSPDFFKIFHAKKIYGSLDAALDKPGNLLISEKMSKAFFADQDPVGLPIRVDNQNELVVSGVYADMPSNSSMHFDFLTAFDITQSAYQPSAQFWKNSSWLIYLLPRADADLSQIEDQVNAIKQAHDPDDKKISRYVLFPMTKWRLYSDFDKGVNVGGMISYVRLFTIVAIIILLTACINFMNLSTARSTRRAQEVGVRKTLGSGRGSLIRQFLFESFLLSLIALSLAMIIVLLLLPAFNTMVGKQLEFPWREPYFWLLSFGILTFTSLVAGSYPALYLSGFNPIQVLKSKVKTGAGALAFRRVLVVAQFVISICLIAAAIVVYHQIRSVKDRPVGYDPNNLLLITASDDIQKNFDVIRNELLQTGAVASLTRSFSPITSIWWKSPAPDWKGKPANQTSIFNGLNVGTDFSKTIGARILAGQDFTGVPSDSAAIILNAAAVKQMGIKPEDAIGMNMKYGRDFTVVAVIDNVVMDSPFKEVEPMMIFYDPRNTYSIAVRLKDGIDPQNGISALSPIFRKYNPGAPFEYKFADDEFNQKFLREDLIRQLSNLFTILALFISVLGLGGLVAYAVETRMKEISVRRVLGASVPQILQLLSREFLALLLLSLVIAVPFAWWGLQKWLNGYNFHVTISPWLFLGIGLVLTLLTLLVVFGSTIRRIWENPVKTLRSE